MKKTSMTLMAVAFCLGSQIGTRALAASDQAAPASIPGAVTAVPNTNRSLPFRGTVASTDAQAKTFTIQAKSGKANVYKVTENSVITKAGNPAAFGDIAANDQIRGSYIRNADGGLEVKVAKLGPLTPEEQAAKETIKAKRAEKKAGKTDGTGEKSQ
jgi:hypothetical protein